MFQPHMKQTHMFKTFVEKRYKVLFQLNICSAKKYVYVPSISWQIV